MFINKTAKIKLKFHIYAKLWKFFFNTRYVCLIIPFWPNLFGNVMRERLVFDFLICKKLTALSPYIHDLGSIIHPDSIFPLGRYFPICLRDWLIRCEWGRCKTPLRYIEEKEQRKLEIGFLILKRGKRPQR